jgi:glutamate synthase (NADPH/NADH) small chain
MYKIIKKEQFSDKVFCMEVEAPLIARSCKPGNFIIVRVDNVSERVPYTIAKADPEKGTLTLVIQEVGLSSTKLCRLTPGDSVHDIVGPLGNPSEIENYGTVICAGGGIGIAAILPILTALKKAGNKVISVLAGRTKNLVIMVDDVKKYSDEVIIMTDDGSYGQKGVVTIGVEQVLKREHDRPGNCHRSSCDDEVYFSVS